MTKDASTYDFNPFNLPERLHKAIGLVITSCVQTEEILKDAIGGCAGLDFEYAGAMTTHMNMPLRFDVLRSVAEIRMEDLDDLDQLDTLLDSIKAAFEKRNKIIHNRWARDPENDELFFITETSRSSYKMEAIPITVAQVEADALAIYEAGMRLMEFLSKRKLLPSLPPAIRPRRHKDKAERKKRRKSGLSE